MLLLDRNFGTHFFDGEQRQPDPLPAPVLVLRAPRGLRGGAARLRHDLGDRAGVLAQAAVRLQGAGRISAGCDRLPGLPGLGPPHVRDRVLDPGRRSGSCVASLAIAVPTGVKIFNWIGTMWMGRIRYEPPMLFAVGFIGMFMIGGLSGIFAGRRPDRPAGHRQLLRGRPLPLRDGHRCRCSRVIGGLHYWYPKITGRMLDRSAGDLELLDALRRLQPDLLPHARGRAVRACRGASPPTRTTRLGADEPDRDAGLVRARDRAC